MTAYDNIGHGRGSELGAEEIFNAILAKYAGGKGEFRKEDLGASLCVGNFRYIFPDTENGPEQVRDELLTEIEKNQVEAAKEKFEREERRRLRALEQGQEKELIH